MAIFADSDIPTMLTDWGNTLTVDGLDAPCALDYAQREVLAQDGGAGQIVDVIVATYRTSDFPDLHGGDPVEVDGVAYTVWRNLKLGDSGTSELWLRVAETS
jgi:hypothetical protein